MRNLSYLPPNSGRLSQKIFYGVITPMEWDMKENPIGFSLFTTKDEDIPIQYPQKMKKILKFLNKPVEIIGDLRKDQFGEEYILVRKIRKISYLQYKQMINKQNGSNYFFDEHYGSFVYPNYADIVV